MQIVGEEVRVAGFGPLAPPASPDALKNAAKAFVRTRTADEMDALLLRIEAAVDPSLCTVAPGPKNVAISLGGRAVARVERYRIFAAAGPLLARGDLLASDEPWRGLMTKLRAVAMELERRELERREARLAAAPAPSLAPVPASSEAQVTPPIVSAPAPIATRSSPQDTADLRFELPDSLEPAAREAAMLASERLRSERRLVPAAAVAIATPQGHLHFEPLREGENPLEARFVFTSERGRVAGGLRLKRPSDPLTLRIGEASPGSLVGHAWAAAMIVYSELTCTDLGEIGEALAEPDAVARRPAKRRPTTEPPARQLPGRRSPASRGHGERHAEVSLSEAINRLQAVSGHLRRLSPGRAASPEARQAAERSGIRLPPGFTWVRPHQRGHGDAIRVIWPHSTRLW